SLARRLLYPFATTREMGVARGSTCRRRQVPHDRIVIDAVESELGPRPLPFRAIEGHLRYAPKPAKTRRGQPGQEMAEEREPAVGVIVESGHGGSAAEQKRRPAAPLLRLDVKLPRHVMDELRVGGDNNQMVVAVDAGSDSLNSVP